MEETNNLVVASERDRIIRVSVRDDDDINEGWLSIEAIIIRNDGLKIKAIRLRENELFAIYEFVAQQTKGKGKGR